MSPDEMKTAFQHYIEEAWNRGNTGILDEMMAPNYARYMNGPQPPLDREKQKRRIMGFRTAFPDIHFDIVDSVASGDKLVSRMEGHGTHQGEFLDMPPTGKSIVIYAIDIVRFADGKIVELWGVMDMLSILQQIRS